MPLQCLILSSTTSYYPASFKSTKTQSLSNCKNETDEGNKFALTVDLNSQHFGNCGTMEIIALMNDWDKRTVSS